MRYRLVRWMTLFLGMNAAALVLLAQTANESGATAIPNLAGIWERRRPSAFTLEGVVCGTANTCGRNAADAVILGSAGTEDWRIQGRAGESTDQVEMHPGLAEHYRPLRPDVEEETARDANRDRSLPTE